ncbi:MAG: HEAT repeat domain-containing protein [Myxococcota bacterium]
MQTAIVGGLFALFFALPVLAQRLSPEEYQAAVAQLADANPEVRREAAELLGRKGWRQRREFAPQLRRMLRRDPDWRVRASSGRSLGRLSVRAAVPDLVAALRDPQVEVRVVAAAALWRLPDPAAVPALVRVLNDSDPAARQWAALALGVIRDPRATEPLAALLNDAEDSVRMDAVRSLGRIGDPNALRPLTSFVSNGERRMEERLEGINSIASLESPDKVNTLVRLLGAEESAIRLRAVAALEQVGDALAIPALRRLRQRENASGRRAIDQALRAIRERMAATPSR